MTCPEEWLTPIQKLEKWYSEAKTDGERFHWHLNICSYRVGYEWPEWKRNILGRHSRIPIDQLLKKPSQKDLDYWERLAKQPKNTFDYF